MLRLLIAACVGLVLSGAAVAGGATLYVGPSATGDGSGSGEANLMSWSVFTGGSRTGDTAYLRNMSSVISEADWPTGVTYYAKYLQRYATYIVAWEFDADERVGQFCNRAQWAVGPVNIKNFTPASTLSAGRITNGSQWNVSPTEPNQGYDNQMDYNTYQHSLNIAFDVNDANALTVAAGKTIISSYSVAAGHTRPQLESVAMLTVLASPAADGSFRPYYCGAPAVAFNKSALNYSLLKTLTPTAHAWGITTVAGWWERERIDYQTVCTSNDYHHPRQAMPNYGSDIASSVGTAALTLNLNYTNSEKEQLLIRFVQYGIDLYGVVHEGGITNFVNAGGHNQGRKLPILYAGFLLNDASMKAVGDKSGEYLYSGSYGPESPPADYIHFGEDDQIFYIDTPDTQHTYDQYLSGNQWTYRSTIAGRISGTITAKNQIKQATTNATGTVLAVQNNSDYDYNRDWVGIEWDGISAPFDLSGTYVCTDQTAGGTFTPDHRTRWNAAGTWQPDFRDAERYGLWRTGWPEWGVYHIGYMEYSNAWFGTEYRVQVGRTLAGLALPALMMTGVKTQWNHPAFFYYTDRYMQLTAPGEPNDTGWYTRADNLFQSEMWDTYRAGYGDVWSPAGPPPPPPPSSTFYYIWKP